LARRVRRKSRRATIGKWSRNTVMGLVYLGIGSAVLGVAGAVAQNFAGLATVTIANNTIDLGIIPSIAMAFGSVLMFLKGLRKIGVSL